MRIPVVLSTDHRYIKPTGVTISSFLRSGESYDIYVICDEDIKEADRKILAKEVKLNSPLSKIEFMQLGNCFDNSFVDRHLTKSCYGRLLIPWLFPQYDTMIYCDSDIIFNIKLFKV